MKQKDFKEIGINPQSISNYETGYSKPDMIVLNKLSEFFGVNIDDLLTKDLEYHAIKPDTNKSNLKKTSILDYQIELLHQEIRHLKETILWKDEKIGILEEKLEEYGLKKKDTG